MASSWLSTQVIVSGDFGWQMGYGAFSISASTLDVVIQYIAQQEEHHKKSDSGNEWDLFLLKKGLI
jgi:putative transposase